MQKPGVYALPIALILAMAAENGLVSLSQCVSTHHMRHATQDGTAASMGPLGGTENMHLVITLPLRNEDQLDQLPDESLRSDQPEL